jgi:hypothetical protein
VSAPAVATVSPRRVLAAAALVALAAGAFALVGHPVAKADEPAPYVRTYSCSAKPDSWAGSYHSSIDFTLQPRADGSVYIVSVGQQAAWASRGLDFDPLVDFQSSALNVNWVGEGAPREVYLYGDLSRYRWSYTPERGFTHDLIDYTTINCTAY